MASLRTPLSFRIFSLAALMLALAAPCQVFGQDFFKELQDKLGVASDKSESSEPASTAENLPAPVRPSAPTNNAPSDSTAGVPAVTPIPLPFEIGDETPIPDVADESSVPTPAVADRPYLGITVEPVQGGGMGLRIVDVTRDSPAWKAGVSPGDQLMAIDSKALSNIDQLASEIYRRAPGDVIKCLIDRRGRSVTQAIVLGSNSLAERAKIAPTTLPPYTPLGTPTSPPETNPTPSIPDNRPSLGVAVERLSENTKQRYGVPVYRGAIVMDVAPNSPAMRAGMVAGDCIVEADGTVIQSEADLQTWMAQVSAGQIVNLQYYRGQSLRTANIRLEARTPTATTQKAPLWLGDNSSDPVGTSPTTNQTQIDVLENRIQSMQQELDRANRELEALRSSR